MLDERRVWDVLISVRDCGQICTSIGQICCREYTLLYIKLRLWTNTYLDWLGLLQGIQVLYDIINAAWAYSSVHCVLLHSTTRVIVSALCTSIIMRNTSTLVCSFRINNTIRNYRQKLPFYCFNVQRKFTKALFYRLIFPSCTVCFVTYFNIDL